MHVFYTQGGGLGHLTRVDKLIKALNIPVGEVLIITPSAFTNYFKPYRFHKLAWQDSVSQWTASIINGITNNSITKFYIDTFPFGLKGELSAVFKVFPTLNYIYISRILKWETYLNQFPEREPPKFSKTILLETLYPSHLNWIEKYANPCEHINLQNSAISTQKRFIETPYMLVVHSGGSNAVLKLCNHLIKNEILDHKTSVIVFTQVKLVIKHPQFQVHTATYPIASYFEAALKIYTAAGFNLMQELKPYHSKHVILPFDKLYDDQYFRAASM